MRGLVRLRVQRQREHGFRWHLLLLFFGFEDGDSLGAFGFFDGRRGFHHFLGLDGFGTSSVSFCAGLGLLFRFLSDGDGPFLIADFDVTFFSDFRFANFTFTSDTCCVSGLLHFFVAPCNFGFFRGLDFRDFDGRSRRARILLRA